MKTVHTKSLIRPESAIPLSKYASFYMALEVLLRFVIWGFSIGVSCSFGGAIFRLLKSHIFQLFAVMQNIQYGLSDFNGTCNVCKAKRWLGSGFAPRIYGFWAGLNLKSMHLNVYILWRKIEKYINTFGNIWKYIEHTENIKVYWKYVIDLCLWICFIDNVRVCPTSSIVFPKPSTYLGC